MNVAALVLAVSAIGQCPPVYVYADPCVQTCPTYRSNEVHEKVYFSGEIRSRCFVNAILVSSGKRITVPVINGYMPSVRITNLADGSILREYDYRGKDVYDGGTIEYGNPPVRKVTTHPTPVPQRAPTVNEERSYNPPPVIQKQMPKYTDEDFEEMRRNIQTLESTIRTLQQKEPEVERPPMTLQADPLRVDEAPRSLLTKPSEFGRDK